MMQCRMTLIGIEGWLNKQGTSFVEGFELTNQSFDKQDFLDALVLKGGELEALVADPNIFHAYCDAWWRKWQLTFQKWWDTMDSEYNALWNYDRSEASADARNSNDKLESTSVNSNYAKTEHDGSISDKTASAKSGNNDLQYKGTSTDYNDVTTFDYHGSVQDPTNPSTGKENSRQYIPKDRHITSYNDDRKDTTSIGETTATSSTQNFDNSDTLNSKGSQASNQNNDHNETYVHSSRTTGNIGVMSTQDLIIQELKLRGKWNLYDKMCAMFLNELAVRVW